MEADYLVQGNFLVLTPAAPIQVPFSFVFIPNPEWVKDENDADVAIQVLLRAYIQQLEG